MSENVVLHERCLALQLKRDDFPPTRPCSSTNLPQPCPSNHYSFRKQSLGSSCVHPTEDSWCSSIITPTSPSTDSDTPTPTNVVTPPPFTPGSLAPSTATFPFHDITRYQDGYLLFQAWQAANMVCVWDKDFMAAIQETMYIGVLVGGILLVGGNSRVLAILSHAWSRSLLTPPSGFTITMLGEVSGCNVMTVPQGQFIPLADALCWVIHRLTENGGQADAELVQKTLSSTFPTLNTPDSTVVHAALSSLIRQRKVYHNGHSYGIVHSNTYELKIPAEGDEVPLAKQASTTQLHCSQIWTEIDQQEIQFNGRVSHVAVQTDLADLIAGASSPSDKVISASSQGGSCHQRTMTLDYGASLRGSPSHRTHTRTASLRLSPTKAAQIARASIQASTAPSVSPITTYRAHDLSDINVKAERGSVLSKLLRVTPRRRLASFSAQFPPQEWKNPNAPVVHLHCVAVQTTSQKNQTASDSWWRSSSRWTPRSSTLPRRLPRPRSSTPPSRNSALRTPPLLLKSFHAVHDAQSVPNVSYTCHHHKTPPCITSHTPAVSPYTTPTHRPQLPGMEESNRFPESTLLCQTAGTKSSPKTRKYCSPVHQTHNSSKLSDEHRHSSPKRDTSNNHMLSQRPQEDCVDEVLEVVIQKSKSPKHDIHHAGQSKKLDDPVKIKRNDEQQNKNKKVDEHHIKNRKFTEQQGKRQCDRHSKKIDEEPNKQIQEHKKCEKAKYGESASDQQYNTTRLYQRKKDQKPQECRKIDKVLKKDQKNVENIKEEGIRDHDQMQFKNQQKLENNVAENKKELGSQDTAEKDQYAVEEKIVMTVLERKDLRGKDESNPESEALTKKIEKLKTNEMESNEKTDLSHERYNRSSLQLDLGLSNMNNSKKIVSSPQRPEGLKNNMLHDNKAVTDISKGSSQDLTTRNLGYRDVDKCHKQMCNQTLDQAQDPNAGLDQEQKLTSSKSKNSRSPKKKKCPHTSDTKYITDISSSGKGNTMTKINEDGSSPTKSDDKPSSTSSPDAENASVKTYPSLSELNLNFSSLAAQKILCGASVNSIDTLLEVNLAAEKRKMKPSDSVTSTDFGFL